MPEPQALTDPATQIPSLVDLSRPDEAAWQRLEALVCRLEDPSLEAEEALILETASRVLTLRAARDGEDTEEAGSIRQMSGPAMLWALERSTTEPFAFARALLETARNLTFDDYDNGTKLVATAQLMVEEAALEESAPRAAADIRALARGYVADDLRFREGRRRDAHRLLREARESVELEGDTEIVARILELEADLASTEKRIDYARECLGLALGRLEGTPIPGRREEALLRLGRVEMARKRPDLGKDVLVEAARTFPRETSSRLRLETLVTLSQAFLAIREYDSAREALEASLELAGSPVDCQRMKSLRLWLEGHLLEQEGELEKALRSFAGSIDLLFFAGGFSDAMRAVSDWDRVFRKAETLDHTDRDSSNRLAVQLQAIMQVLEQDDRSQTILQLLRFAGWQKTPSQVLGTFREMYRDSGGMPRLEL